MSLADDVAAIATGLERVVLSSNSEPAGLSDSQKGDTATCGEARGCPEEEAGACGEAAGVSSDILFMELAKAEVKQSLQFRPREGYCTVYLRFGYVAAIQ